MTVPCSLSISLVLMISIMLANIDSSFGTNILDIEGPRESLLYVTKVSLQLPRPVFHQRRTHPEPSSPLSGKPPLSGHAVSPARSRVGKNDEGPSSFQSISAHGRPTRQAPKHKGWTQVNLCEAKIFDPHLQTGIEARFMGETGFLLFGDGIQQHMAILASIAPFLHRSAFNDAIIQLKNVLGEIRLKGVALVYLPLSGGEPLYDSTERLRATEILRTAGAKSLINVWYETSKGYGYMGLDNQMKLNIYVRDELVQRYAKDVATLQNNGLNHPTHAQLGPSSHRSPKSPRSKARNSQTHSSIELDNVYSLLHSDWVDLPKGFHRFIDLSKENGIESLYEDGFVGVALLGDSLSKKVILASLAPTDEQNTDHIEVLAYEHSLRDFAIVYYPRDKKEEIRPITRRLRRIALKVGGIPYNSAASPGYLGIGRDMSIRVRRDCGDYHEPLEDIRNRVGRGISRRSILTPWSQHSSWSSSTSTRSTGSTKSTKSSKSLISPSRSKSEYSEIWKHGIFSFPESPAISHQRNRTPSMSGLSQKDDLVPSPHRDWIQVLPGSAKFADFERGHRGIEAMNFLGGTGIIVVNAQRRKAFLAHVLLTSLEAGHELGIRAKLDSGSDRAILYSAVGEDRMPIAPNLKQVEEILENIGVKKINRVVYDMWKPETTYLGINDDLEYTAHGREVREMRSQSNPLYATSPRRS